MPNDYDALELAFMTTGFPNDEDHSIIEQALINVSAARLQAIYDTNMLATLAIDLQGPWNESISTQVVTLLFSIITVPACRTAFLESSGHEAQTLLDVFQKYLDNSSNMDPHRLNVLFALTSLAHTSDKLPSSYSIHVEAIKRPLTYGNALISHGMYQGAKVVLKQIGGAHRPGHTVQQRQSRAKSLRTEALVWFQLRHPRILPLLGVQEMAETPGASSRALVSLHMREDLQTYVNGKTMPRYVRTRLLEDVADALIYLHEHRIVHGDIKPFNILVHDEDGHDRALLFDFGTAKTNSLLLRPDVHQGGGTVIWMAPTPIALEQSNWYARDVWAFGQLCRWICTNVQPYADRFDYAALILAGKIMDRPTVAECVVSYMDSTLWEVSTACMQHSMENRPSMEEVRSALSICVGEVVRSEHAALPVNTRVSVKDVLGNGRMVVAGPDGRTFDMHPGNISTKALFRLKAKIPHTITDTYVLGDQIALQHGEEIDCVGVTLERMESGRRSSEDEKSIYYYVVRKGDCLAYVKVLNANEDGPSDEVEVV